MSVGMVWYVYKSWEDESVKSCKRLHYWVLLLEENSQGNEKKKKSKIEKKMYRENKMKYKKNIRKSQSTKKSFA